MESETKWVDLSDIGLIDFPMGRSLMATDAARTKIYNSFYRYSVDGKRRVQVPSKWRPQADEVDFEYTLVVWPNSQLGACLRAFPPNRMADFMDTIQKMSAADKKAVSLRRYLGSHSDQAVLDKGGRICLPEAMVQESKIKSEAVLVGCLDFFEIWSPDRYRNVNQADEMVSEDALSLI